MVEQLSFITLSEDVLNIIVSLLHSESPRSLRDLSLVSKFCKQLADPLLYRSIELSDADQKLAITERKIHRLLNPSDELPQHVRELRVVDFRGNSEKFSPPKLESIIDGLFQLKTFNWEGNANIPECVISKLEQQWPSAKLIVTKHDLGDTDTRLLSSPNLYALTFGILNIKRGHEMQDQKSKLPELRAILINSPQLKKLDIKTKYSWIPQHEIWSGDEAILRRLNLPLQPSDRLPDLRELRISGPDAYEFDLENCQLWSRCMDWSQLQTLDIGFSCPQHFFDEIARDLTSLKTLTMGIRTGDRKYKHWVYGPMTCENIGSVARFIEAVPNLRELHITDLDSGAEVVAPSILGSQKSLQTLSYHALMHRTYRRRKLPYAWTTTQLHELRQQSPDLSCLVVDFPLENGKWPTEYANALARFNHLQSLKVFVELNEDASDFSKEYHQDARGDVPTPIFNKSLGREVTTNLFLSFFVNDTYARLTTLEVCFIREEVYDRGQRTDIEFPIKIRRFERNDAPSPANGGFTIECQGKWLGGWW